MFRPQIQKTRILVLIAIFNLLMVYFAVNSKVKVYQVGYDRKIEASSIMKNTIDSFKSLITLLDKVKSKFSLISPPVTIWTSAPFSIKYWAMFLVFCAVLLRLDFIANKDTIRTLFFRSLSNKFLVT